MIQVDCGPILLFYCIRNGLVSISPGYLEQIRRKEDNFELNASWAANKPKPFSIWQAGGADDIGWVDRFLAFRFLLVAIVPVPIISV